MILKKLQNIIKRHPLLYLTRFRLLSKNSNLEDIKDFSYNLLNIKEEIPSYFYDINKLVFLDAKPLSDLEKVKKLGIWLQENIKGGPGLSEPSEKALRTMLYGKGGVCSDMAQIFNNFCVINDISVREWGTTSAPFNRAFGGHSFNEIYSKELKKWVLIDVYWSFLFYNEENQPLSVIEVFQLKRDEKEVFYKSFNQKKNLKLNTINRNYLNLNIIPFLICDYRNKTYDCFLGYLRPYTPIFMVHFVIYLMKKSYHYRFPLDDYKKIFS
jgi:hypothetical protein